MNQFKSATLTVLIGVTWRTSIYSNPKDNVNPSQVRMDVECYLNLHMPGWHHVDIIDKPVRNLSMPQNSLGQHSVTVEVFYRSDELKRSACWTSTRACVGTTKLPRFGVLMSMLSGGPLSLGMQGRADCSAFPHFPFSI